MPITPYLLYGANNAAQPADQPNLAAMTTAFCNFVENAHSTLYIAAYHFKFFDAVAVQIRDALAACVARGVEVKIAYFDEPKRGTVSKSAYGGDAGGASIFADAGVHADYTNKGIHLKAIQSIDISNLPEGVVGAPIEGDGALMHSKYIVRDNAAVWMGSANFTEDGWGLQDNNVLVFEAAPELAAYYTTDFEDLWHYGRIAGTGKDDTGTLVIDGDTLSVDFSPGDGKAIDRAIASLIDQAEATLHVASMVISSTAVLQALANAVDRGVTLTGTFDGPQMKGVVSQWQRGNATRNAENVINLTDAGLAAHYVEYIEKLVAMYK